MSTKIQPKELSQYIDHTLLKADAGKAAIEKLCAEALQYHFYSVCVNSSWVPFCVEALKGSTVKVSAVCGFPLGAMSSEAKAYEACWAVDQGAHDIDMVLPIGLLLNGNEEAVYQDILGVTDAVGYKGIVKVILETGFLNEEQKKTACRLSEEAGAHFVKTSTGFGPGGATLEDVRLMRASVGPGVQVKASGGVRDMQTALAMIEAGATRLGTSSGVALVSGLSGSTGY
jgi:deoxyribose-phosphate aldolase